MQLPNLRAIFRRRSGPAGRPTSGAEASVVAQPTEVSSPKKEKASDTETLKELATVARTLRRHIVTMTGRAGSGHPGGSLSAVDIITALYFHTLRHDPQNPRWEDRDRFILSKGHCVPALYAALAEAGYFPVETLPTLRRFGSSLQGHSDSTATPGVEMSAGSLGQGLSFGIGCALAARLDGRDCTVYVLMGDGECDEGQVWEATMAAANFELDKLVAIVDANGQQNDDWVHIQMKLEPFNGAQLGDKWRAFGWHVLEIDGHSLEEIITAFDAAKSLKGKPTVIVARTIKGKGVSFMENNVSFHGRAPTPEQVEQALAELAE